MMKGQFYPPSEFNLWREIEEFHKYTEVAATGNSFASVSP